MTPTNAVKPARDAAGSRTMTECWLRANALYESADVLVPLSKMVGLRDCDYIADFIHLIPRRIIKEKYPLWSAASLRDERVVRVACRQHHHMLDVSKTLRLTRESLPASVEEFAEEFGFTAWLEREYGAPERWVA